MSGSVFCRRARRLQAAFRRRQRAFRPMQEVTRGFTLDETSQWHPQKAGPHHRACCRGSAADGAGCRRRGRMGPLRDVAAGSARLHRGRRIRYGAHYHDSGKRRDHGACRVPAGKPRSCRTRPGEPVRHRCHHRYGRRTLLRASRHRPCRHCARGGGQYHRRPGRCVHHHSAAGASDHPLFRDERHHHQAQGARDVPGAEGGGDLLQRRHPAHVPEHHQLRLGCLRHPGGGAALLLEERFRFDAGRGGDACGHSPVSDVQQPHRPS